MERRVDRLSRALVLVITVAALASLMLAGAAVAAEAATANYVPNEYIIHVTAGTPRADVDKLAARMGAVVVNKLPLNDTYLIRLEKRYIAKSMTATTAASSRVFSTAWKIDYIQPNYLSTVYAVPNDELYDDLWGMEMIKMPQAWDVEKGSTSVIVAVNDTGVVKHPDLIDRLLPGYNCVEENNDPYTVDNPHGTHVAGTIAAMGNNGIGVTGVCWDGVKILPIRVALQGRIPSADSIEGLDFAMRNGANVVNMSYGKDWHDPAEHNKIKQLAGAGIILVAAAGNDGNDEPKYPAVYDECITVSSVGPTEAPAYYTSYGSHVDIAAPGGDQSFENDPNGILSTYIDLNAADGVDPLGYHFLQGTSMAAPHVAGAAALLLSHGVAPSQVRARLLETARPPRSGNMDSYIYGAGIMDVYAALSEATLRIIKPLRGGFVGPLPEVKINIKGIETSSVRIYLDYADDNNDGIPDNFDEIPIIDSSNIGYHMPNQNEIVIDWEQLGYQGLSALPADNPHQIYVKGESDTKGVTFTDWVAFTVTSRVIPQGIHMFAFPYSLATAATHPEDILLDRQTGQNLSTSAYSLISWLPKAYNSNTGHLECRYAYYPDDIQAWVYPYDTMPNPWNSTSPYVWNTAGGYPANEPGNFKFPAGAGFWLILSQDAVIADAKSYPTLNAPNGYTIRLYDGWNMIGNPYDHDVSWKALISYRGSAPVTLQEAEARGWIRSSLYGYRTAPTAGYYLVPERSMLKAYTGYWLRASVGGVDPSDSLTMTILP